MMMKLFVNRFSRALLAASVVVAILASFRVDVFDGSSLVAEAQPVPDHHPQQEGVRKVRHI
jgi:hypothetical protein